MNTKHLIQNLSKQEKLKLVQVLWDDIVNHQNEIDVSTDHKKIIEERLNIINEGRANYRSWEDIRKKYQQ